MPNPPRQTTMNVILKSVDEAQADPKKMAVFELQPVGVDPLPPPNGPNQTLIFDNVVHGVGHNGVNIDYVLIDQSGKNYLFPPNNKKADAVSSELGATDRCPLQRRNDVLSPINVSPDKKTLSVHNPNQNKPGGPNLTGPFSYVLWVTKDGGENYVPLDPGGVNNNGSIG